MTPDELIAEIYARQGYLVLGCQEPYGIGDRIECNAPMMGEVVTPLQVESVGTRAEFDAQDRLSKQISGLPMSPPKPIPFFYRVVAMD